MPHATENGGVAADDLEFENVMSQINAPHGGSFDFMSRALEPGEKADDAIDYEDIDDDDLPEEENAPTAAVVQSTETQTAHVDGHDELWSGDKDLFGDDGAAAEQENHNEVDDLFGDVPSSPVAEQGDTMRDLFFDDEKPTGDKLPVALPSLETQPVDEDDIDLVEEGAVSPTDEDMDPATLRAYKLQQALFAMSGVGPDDSPPSPENVEELLVSLWPDFDRSALPRFLELIPHKKAHFVGKQPLKLPKPVIPTKVHLDFGQDQERVFKTGGQGNKRALESEHLGLVAVHQVEEEEEAPEEDLELDVDDDEILPGGVTMQDLRILCTDWEVKSDIFDLDVDQEASVDEAPNEPVDDEMMWFAELESTRPAKKRRLGREPHELISLFHVDIPIIDDPERATAQIAKKVILDMNDPHLLLDTRPEAVSQRPKTLNGNTRDEMDVNATKRFTQRYNISNDDAYDMLKENHQSKVRSTLGSVTLEHSMPALRLQWPYYKTELSTIEARSFHRPAISFRSQVTSWFKNPAHIKRKHQRGKDAKTLFDSTKSLSMGDNSTMLLLEHSEEVPIMMSNFGMANRFINYYRRKNAEDSTRPKSEIGETHVLLPQDKSPFSIFGHIDPGETTPAISNTMYRAPVFGHNAQSTDFLVVRNTTKSDGSDYYMKNIENLFVVGQQLPSTDVPGPHSRKVTTVAKNRLKMLTFRLMRREKNMRVSISQVTAHLPGSSDMQNRQKMKDFVLHDKDTKQWVPIGGIPDPDTIRSWIQPEDVCLLDSMQVGQQHLHDTGYSNDADEDNEDADGESFEQQMAPWRTTRNFMMASQGKAMLKLHGEGDPTGRGEGFSFIKTSMKGGFQPIGLSVEDTLEKRRQDFGGHSYNVARQQKSYETSIRRIWDAQKSSLSSAVETSDIESDDGQDEEEDFNKPTPRDAPTPAYGRRDDDIMSQFSKMSTASQQNKVLKITRDFKDEKGNIYQKEQLVWDPRVIRQYTQYRHHLETVNTKSVITQDFWTLNRRANTFIGLPSLRLLVIPKWTHVTRNCMYLLGYFSYPG
jgi:hypothetical protein